MKMEPLYIEVGNKMRRIVINPPVRGSAEPLEGFNRRRSIFIQRLRNVKQAEARVRRGQKANTPIVEMAPKEV